MKHLVPISNVVAIAHGAQEPSLGDGKGVPGDPESRHWSLFHICVSPATLQRKGKDIVGGTENSCSPHTRVPSIPVAVLESDIGPGGAHGLQSLILSGEPFCCFWCLASAPE